MVYARNRFGEGSGPIHLDDVDCRGDEESLADCQHAGWGANNCQHHEDVSILCVDNLDITGNRLLFIVLLSSESCEYKVTPVFGMDID